MASKGRKTRGGTLNCVASWSRVSKEGGVIYAVHKDCELHDIVKYMRNKWDPEWDPEAKVGAIHITTKKTTCVSLELSQ